MAIGHNILNELQVYADRSVERFSIPAISLALWYEGRLYAAASGVLNTETGVKATTESVFQIGSISKVFTACLIMRLFEQGRLTLDAPACSYLREFHLGDRNAAETITLRQLLTHTSGMAGDFFTDAAHLKDDSIARYVDRCYWLPQLHEPGANFSYCNSGYSILGRIIERLMGMSWFDAIEQYIFTPLGMKNAIAHPYDLLRCRAAIGHTFQGDKAGWAPASPANFGLGLAPAGATLCMSPTDLITFARAHLEGGHSQNGDQWLSEMLVQQMRKPQVALHPCAPLGVTDWGLGWFFLQPGASGNAAYGHDGSTPGQQALLRILPDHGLAIAANINAENNTVLREVSNDIAGALTGAPLAPDYPTVDLTLEKLAPLPGRYESMGATTDVVRDGSHLKMQVFSKIYQKQTEDRLLLPVGGNAFEARTCSGRYQSVVAFVDPDKSGAPKSLHMDFRLHRRVMTP